MAAYQSLLGRASGVSQGNTVSPFNQSQNSAFQSFDQIPSQYQQGALGAVQSSGQPISAGQIANYSNPFQQSVIDATMANLNESNAQGLNQVKGNAIAQGALGNNRLGVAQGEVARQQALATGQTLAGLNSQNYSQALGAAQGDRDAAARQAGLYGGLQTQALQGATAQLGSGNQQQQRADASLQQPYDQAEWLSKIYGNIGPLQGGTTTSETPGPNVGSQLLGAGLAAASLVPGMQWLPLAAGAAGAVGGLFGGSGGSSAPTSPYANMGGLYAAGGQVRGMGTGGLSMPSQKPMSRVHEMMETALELAHKIKTQAYGGAVTDIQQPRGYQGGGIAFSPFSRFDEASPDTPPFDPGRFDAANGAPDGLSGPTAFNLDRAQGIPEDDTIQVPGITIDGRASQPSSGIGAGSAPAMAGMGTAQPAQPSQGGGDEWRQPLLAAGLGMLASKSPFIGTAIGEGGLAGLGAYSQNKEAQAKQAQTDREFGLKQRSVDLDAKQLEQSIRQAAEAQSKPMQVAAGASLYDPKTGNAIYTAPMKGQGTNAPSGYRYKEDGTLEAIPGGPAAGGRLRVIPQNAIAALGAAGEGVTNLDRLTGTFDDKFSGQPLIGDARNTLGRLGFPGGDRDQAEWWQDYQNQKNVIRNKLFGSALTATEKAEFDKANIDPGTSAEVVRKNLKLQADAAHRAAEKIAKTYVAQGYSTDVIESAVGLTMDELASYKHGNDSQEKTILPPNGAAPVPETGGDPVRVSSPDEAASLPPGTHFITPDGQLRIKH